MYLTTETRAESPWKIKKLNQEIYTLDGLCIQLYYRPETVVSDLDMKPLRYWIQEALGLDAVAERLNQMIAQGSELLEMAHFLLDQCPFTRSLDRSIFDERWFQIVAVNPSDSFRERGNRAYEHHNFLEALIFYGEGQKRHYSWLTENNMALVQLQLGNYGKAEEALMNAIAKGGDYRCRYNLARVYWRLNQFQKMLRVLDEVERANGQHQLWYLYGLAYEGLQRYEECIAAYTRSIEEGGGFSVFRAFIDRTLAVEDLRLLKIWMKHHRLSGAMRLYAQARMDLHIGEIDAYVASLETAADVAEDPLPYVRTLIEHYIDQGQTLQALTYLQRLPEPLLTGEIGQYYNGQIHRLAGKTDTYQQKMMHILDHWKAEVRKTSGKQAVK